MSGHVRRRITPSLPSGLLSSCRGKCQHSTTPPTRGVDPMCFSGSGPTHFLRWIVYYCVCIQHDIDKSQISFIELCKTLRTNSGLRAINSCLHLFWPELCKAYWVNIDWWQQNVKFSFHQQTVQFGSAHIFTQIYAPAADQRPVHFRLRRVDAAHGYMCRTFRGLCVSACLSVQANSHRRRRTRHRLDCLVVSGGRRELGIRHGQPECDRDTSVTIDDRCKSDWTDQDPCGSRQTVQVHRTYRRQLKYKPVWFHDACSRLLLSFFILYYANRQQDSKNMHSKNTAHTKYHTKVKITAQKSVTTLYSVREHIP